MTKLALLCACCTAPFVTNRPSQRFCSPRCRLRAKERREFGKPESDELGGCRWCGIDISHRRKSARYCSTAHCNLDKVQRFADCAAADCTLRGDSPRPSSSYCRWHRNLLRAGLPLSTAKRQPKAGCDVAGCPRPHYGLGFCQLHMRRLRTTGTTDPRTPDVRLGALPTVSTRDPLDLREHAPTGWLVDGSSGKVFGGQWRWREIGHHTVGGYLYAGHGGSRDGWALHRVVWEACVGPIPPTLVVNHRNGVKDDNRLANLEVVTQRENALHAWRTGLTPPPPLWLGGEFFAWRLTYDEAEAIRDRRGERVVDLAREFGVTGHHVQHIQARRRWLRRDGGLAGSLIPSTCS